MANPLLTPQATVEALYAALSCRPGEAIRREDVLALFAQEARILFAGRDVGGEPELQTFPVNDFLDRIALQAGGGRTESELLRRVESFGNVAHVWSAYELVLVGREGAPVTRRGINSVQLHFDGAGWKVLSLLWDIERPGAPLPPFDSPRTGS
jgi:hypothetical protein